MAEKVTALAGRRKKRPDAVEVDEHLGHTVDMAAASRERRRTRYEWLRLWYTRGTDQMSGPARYNKLQSHVDQLSSYLYGPEGTRFSLSVPPRVRDKWLPQALVARDEFTRVWRDTGADVLFAQVVDWSLIFGTTFLKLTPLDRDAIQVDYVSPADIGVLREDIPELDRQEVLVHWYCLSLSEFAQLVDGMANAKEAIDLAEQRAIPAPEAGNSARPNVVQQIIATSAQPDEISGILALGTLGDERPQVEEPIVELAEVWEKAHFWKRDKKGNKVGDPVTDYVVTTMLGQYAVVPARRNPVLPAMSEPYWMPGELPFVKVATKPLRDYFWGVSELSGLVQLQDWREIRMVEMDELLKRNLDPPRAFSGFNLTDEKLKALNSIGGFISSPIPSARAENLAPEIPPQGFEMIDRIDAMFAEAGGLQPILQGQNPPDVRAGGQLQALAGIAAGGRIRKKALLVEDALEIVATRLFHLMQRRDPTPYPFEVAEEMPKPPTFLLSHLPPDTKVLVSAHSASPVYAQELAQKAAMLYEAGAIDMPTLIDFMNVPMAEELRVKAKELQKGKAAVAAKQMEIEMMKAQRRYGKAPS